MLSNLIVTLVVNMGIFMMLKHLGVSVKALPWVIGSVIGFALAQLALYLIR
jgi:hypothetical protein